MLDEKDLEFIDALRSLEVPRNVAGLITFLANTNEATSRQIEVGTNMRQPEVSIAMCTHGKTTGLTNAMLRPREKVGPRKSTSSGVPIQGQLQQHYEVEKNNEAAKTMQAIQRLKELSSA